MKFKSLPEEKTDSHDIQSKPDHTKWSIWFKFIANVTRKRQKLLKQSLGEWIVDFEQIRKRYACHGTSTHISTNIDKTGFTLGV